MTQPTNDSAEIDEILLKPASWQLDDWVKAKQQLHQELMAIVGEDEPEIILDEQIPSAWHKNKLRQELREKLEKW